MNSVKDSWDRLQKAIHDDPGYAWAVHCNFAMPIMDSAEVSHELANKAAANLMQHFFKYDVTKHPHWRFERVAERPPAPAIPPEVTEALSVANQALLEVQHAQHNGSRWYTQGESGLYRQVAMWTRKGSEAIAAAQTALAEGKPAALDKQEK